MEHIKLDVCTLWVVVACLLQRPSKTESMVDFRADQASDLGSSARSGSSQPLLCGLNNVRSAIQIQL